MIPSEIRKKAREALSGNWGKGICILLAYFLVSVCISFILSTAEKINNSVYLIVYMIYIAISAPLAFGFTISFLKLKRNEQANAFSFLTEGLSKFSKAWGIWFHTFIRLLLPVICMILSVCLIVLLYFTSAKTWLIVILGVVLYVATIVYVVSRSLLYFLANYIAYDNPTLSAKECVLKSEELMRGNRGNLFLLLLSFIGWAILSTITFGLGFIWLIPYVQVTTACFYDEINTVEAKKVDGKVKVEVND